MKTPCTYGIEQQIHSNTSMAENKGGSRKLGRHWTNEEILQEIKKRAWYHKIQLRPGIVTPGIEQLVDLWNMTRQSRGHISYAGKRVLDLASFDGMWSFEAEKLGASLVVATDCLHLLYSNFEFCKNILQSKVVPFYNITPYKLWEGLQVLLMDDVTVPLPFPKQIYYNKFDVVQHLGLLYHLRDPMWTLSQSRSVLKTGGHLLLETACILDMNQSMMVYNGPPGKQNRLYSDITTWLLPTVPCLMEMLRGTMFEPIPESIRTIPSGSLGGYEGGRISLVARAIPASEMDREAYAELLRIYRNPGLVPDYL
jgi:SAM-dependent methyltransferase